MLGIESLTTRYGAITAVRDVELTVRAGEIVCLIGPNGAGKTTLLSTISGLLKPSTGRVVLDGNDVTGWAPDQMLRSGLALVPEHRRIFADFTVRENLMVGGVTQTASRREQLFDEITSLFPILKERLYTQAGFLSGGEAQRVAIARAVIHQPALILADEPTGNLDSETGRTILEVLMSVNRDSGTALLLATHDPAVAAAAGEVIQMSDGHIMRDSS